MLDFIVGLKRNGKDAEAIYVSGGLCFKYFYSVSKSPFVLVVETHHGRSLSSRGGHHPPVPQKRALQTKWVPHPAFHICWPEDTWTISFVTLGGHGTTPRAYPH